MFKRLFMLAVTMMFAVTFAFGAFLLQVRALGNKAIESEITSRQYQAPDLAYRFTYPLDSYSVEDVNTSVNGTEEDVSLVVIEPNDALIYRDAQGTVYKLSIAAANAPEGTALDAKLFGTGPLMQYETGMFDPDHVYEVDLGGVTALRVDNLSVGSTDVAADILAVHEGLLYEIVVEPVNGKPSESLDEGRRMVEDMLASFRFGERGA